MVRKKLATAILALSALQANFADALGLGNLSIKSALNQPLNAEIRLLETGDLDPTQVRIQLAAQEDFERSGVDRDYFLTNLRFSVVMDGRGGGTIHITTREPVVEPYLNFVLEARWPNGRLLREFAVLLDPPTFSANKGAGGITPAVTAQPARKPAIQPPSVSSETQTTRSIPEAGMSLPASAKPGEYRVQVYDTLSKIAARYKPASDVSVAQTMLAIQRANPEAFINNNINLIKSGAIVRLPDADEARGISGAQAAQEVEQQTHAWRTGAMQSGSASSAATGPQLDASAPAATSGEGGYREQARLSIAATGTADKAAAGSGSGTGGGDVRALRDQLTASQEALDKGRRDNRELQSRLDDMERQIATLQRLISLKDDQLAALQAKSGAPAGDKPAAAAPTETAAAPAPAPVESAPATAESTPAANAEAPAAAPAQPAPQPAKPKPVAKPAPAKPAAEPSLLDQLTGNPLYLGGAAAALLALIGAVVWKRRKDAEEQEAEDDFVFDENDTFQFGAAAPDSAAESDEPEPAPAAAPAPAAGDSKPIRPETGDAIAESDIYIAYGRYQQAVDLLSNAIDAEPARADLRVKLLEVYVEMRNKEAFRRQFVALQALGDGQAIAQVKDLLSSVDGVSDWLDDLPGASGSGFGAAALAGGAAAAFAAADATDAANAEPAFEANPAGDDELDLDLDGLDGELEAAPAIDLTPDLEADLDAPGAAIPADDHLGLDDLDIDGDEADLEFNLELDADSEAASSQELSDLSLDLDGAPPEAIAPHGGEFESPAEPTSAFAQPATEEPQAADEGFELDLEDDLDQMLGTLDDNGALADLEDFNGDATAPAANAEQGFDLDLNEEFDLGSAGEDLAAAEPAIDVFAPLEQPPAAIDLSQSQSGFGQQTDGEAGSSFDSGPTAAELESSFLPEPEPVSESAAVEAPTLDAVDDFDFLSDSDEVATKLDLARAYIDMGDTDGARDILDEVLQEGTDNQKDEASSLLSRIG